MSTDPFLGEVLLASFNVTPKGWALCNGQSLPINQNLALFSLIGTTFGGDGRTTFLLPDLRGRVPMHAGQGHLLGERAGTESVIVTVLQMPAHIHAVNVVNSNANAGPTGHFLAAANALYQPPPNNVILAPNTITEDGGSQPHENRQPHLVLSFIIALQGIFPSHN